MYVVELIDIADSVGGGGEVALDNLSGKENVDPTAKPTLPRRPRMKKASAEDEDVFHCTQIPNTRSKATLKRTRKQEQAKACGKGGDTPPRTPRISRSRKGATACELDLLTLQTPMPESEAGSEFGPPPPDTTPAPLRESSPPNISFHSPYFCECCQNRVKGCL